MQILNNKATLGQLTAAEWNEVPSELQNAITRSGQTLSGADLEQLAKAIVDTAASASFYTDSGTANTYVLGAVGGKLGLSQLAAATDGAIVRFRAGNNNTGASTINVASLGVKDIRDQSGAALVGGEILTTKDTELRYDQANDRWLLAAAPVGGGGGVASYVSVPIPADITDITDASEQTLTWDYSARNESEDWFGGLTSDQSDIEVPSGISRVTVNVQVSWASQAITDIAAFRIRLFHNGASSGFGPHSATTQDLIHGPQNIAFFHNACFPLLEVAATDIITVRVTPFSGVNTQDILSAQTYVNIFGFTS